jgi:hypothetical protein
MISQARVKEDERYDGKWVVHTSRRHDIFPEDVACILPINLAGTAAWARPPIPNRTVKRVCAHGSVHSACAN